MLLRGLLLSVRRSLARILRLQERRDDQHLRKAIVMRRRQQHAAEPGVHRQPCDLASQAGDPTLIVHGLQLLQEPHAVIDEPRVRRIEEREVFRFAQPDRRHPQDHAREIRAQNLRRSELLPLRKVLLRIQADADPFRLAPAASLALIRAGPGNTFDRQPLDLTSHAVAADARQPRVDDVAYSGNGQRGFGHVGGQHDAPDVVLLEDSFLITGGEPRKQRKYFRVGEPRLLQLFGSFPDMLFSRKENERVRARGSRSPIELTHGLDNTFG